MKRFGNFRTLFRVYGRYRYHVAVLALLGVLGAFLDGVAVNIAIPSISFLVNGGVAAPTDVISKSIATLFSLVGVSFTFRHLIEFITILLIFRSLILIVFGYIRGFITGDFLAKESKTLLAATFAASWPYLLAQRIGHVQNSLERDLQRSSNLLEALAQVIQSTSGFLIYLLIALNISPQMTILTAAAGGVLVLIVRPLLKRTQYAGLEMATTDKAVSQFVTEHLIGMKTVKAGAHESAAYQKGAQLFERLKALYMRIALIRSIGSSLFQPFAMIFIIILFTLTYHSGSFNIISFAATLYLIQKIFTYIESGQASLHGVRELIPYAENIDRFKQELAAAKDELRAGTHVFDFKKAITFENVSFAYDAARPVLTNVSFTILPGETTAVIGPSGSGKTSLVDLLLCLFRPTSGRITVDNIALEEIELSSLRSRIGYVTQDAFLLHASIEENIRFYRPELTSKDIAEAVERAHLTDVVAELPDGLATMVGDRGVMLSGGQRQRVALARALAGTPEILILDEATSALDRESERVVQEAIEELHGTVTVLVIAHRLSTIENADRIVVLDHGQVIETGTPKELAARSGSYYAKHSQKGS